MKCTDKERQTCNVEKMGCEGCYYNEDNDRDIEELKTLFYSDKLTQYGKRKFIEYYEQRIKACKELEYKYNKALSDLVQAEHKNKELEEENEVWKNSYYEQKEFNNKQALYIAEKFIPVSLVEETIEELKQERTLKYDNYMGYKIESREQQDIDKKIQVLQELLEKRK